MIFNEIILGNTELLFDNWSARQIDAFAKEY